MPAKSPDITSACTYWQSNDGDGLDAAGSLALANRLQAEIDAGRTLIYAKRYTGALEALPNIPCDLCGGTGKRTGMEGCNGCRGEGYVRPFATFYQFSVENVQEFVTFLRACGGFEIC